VTPKGNIVIEINGVGRVNMRWPQGMDLQTVQAYLLQSALQINAAVQRKTSVVVPGGVN